VELEDLGCRLGHCEGLWKGVGCCWVRERVVVVAAVVVAGVC
jgi:hypothetical protein